MRPIFITLQNESSLIIIPDSQAHVNGHPVLTYTYSIYRNNDYGINFQDITNNLHLEKNSDPNYLGFITFEQPDKLFTYTPDGKERLSSGEIEEVIEHVSHFRDTPSQWAI